MTETQRAAVQAALEAIQELEYSSSTAVGDKIAREAKQALRAALAEQDAEPPRREWQGLTDEEIEDVWEDVSDPGEDGTCVVELARAIEQKLKEKNHD